ncbi:hypothetical protein C8R45DRAFT_1054592 [Mycena sanguinolenta]|nr:hypothetical protein C8R45DRAFT_1054592 [Mycena sanguinolenta]
MASYPIIEVVKQGRITKPIVVWAIGTCAMFDTEVQFGHKGSMADLEMETADVKNKAMRAVGFVVPETFEELLRVQKTYENLVKKGVVMLKAEMDTPELGLICKPAASISTISDECGEELLYAGKHISNVFK